MLIYLNCGNSFRIKNCSNHFLSYIDSNQFLKPKFQENDDFLTYLFETPFVKTIGSDGEEFLEFCQMHSNFDIDPLALTSSGRTKRQSTHQRFPAGSTYFFDK